MSVKPITPSDIDKGRANRRFPDEVIEAFNELIVEKNGRVLQKDVVERIVFKMQAQDPKFDREAIYRNGWLDVEPLYRKAGWQVVYDKPGYCESYEANFRFTRKR